MEHLSAFLQKRQKELVQKTVFSQHETLLSILYNVAGIPRKFPITVSWKKGVVIVQASAVIKSELFSKKQKILAAFKQKFPTIAIEDIR